MNKLTIIFFISSITMINDTSMPPNYRLVRFQPIREYIMFEAKPNFWCQKCRAGEFLVKHCEYNGGESTCETCPNKKYTPKPNNRTYCQDCSYCDRGQEVLKTCTKMSDTVCQCLPGTYYHPHEGKTGTCFQHTVCPEGTTILVEGTPWNDTVCGVTTTTPTPNTSPQSPSTSGPTQTTTDRYMTLSTTSVTSPDPQVSPETESDKHCCNKWFMVAVIEMVIIIVMILMIIGYIIIQRCLIGRFRPLPQTDPQCSNL